MGDGTEENHPYLEKRVKKAQQFLDDVEGTWRDYQKDVFSGFRVIEELYGLYVMVVRPDLVMKYCEKHDVALPYQFSEISEFYQRMVEMEKLEKQRQRADEKKYAQLSAVFRAQCK